MPERCSHAQCSAPATARVAFDSLACFVWIDPYEAAGPRDVGARGAGALCTRHADRLVAPRGWAVQDRRSTEPPLWSDRPVVEHPAPLRPVARRAEPVVAAVAPVVTLDDPLPFDAAPAPSPTPTPAPAPAPAIAAVASTPTQPARHTEPDPVRADPVRDDIEALLARPTSPLLSRAFDRARGGQTD